MAEFKPTWMPPKLATMHYAGPSGEIVQIRPVDPEFSDSEGNIELNQYVTAHDEYFTGRLKAGDIVYHYTSLSALCGIMREGAIWASDARMLNDRFEIHFALERMHGLLSQDGGQNLPPQPLDAIFRPARAVQFVTCLSRVRDQLSQWRAYAKNVGVAIGFDREHLSRAVSRRQGSMVECRYLGPDDFEALRPELEPIVQAIRAPGALSEAGTLTDMRLQERLTDMAVEIAVSVKHRSFDEERELRMVLPMTRASAGMEFRSSQQSLIPFSRIDIDGRRLGFENRMRYTNHLGMLEIVVWPNNVDDQTLDAIDLLAASTGHVLIRRSDSPYRT